VFLARFVPALLPFEKRILVDTQDFAAFDSGHFEVEPALLDLLTDMLWLLRILVCFP